MTIANDILFLALRNGGITGIGQIPSAADINDSFKVLNAWINELNLERRVMVNPVVLPTFPDLTADVSFWSPYEHVLLTSMSVRLRQIYALPPVDLDVQLALSALQAFQAINLQAFPAPFPSVVDPLSITWILSLALREAGRFNDTQHIDASSYDFVAAQYHAVQMIEEWKREREVFVIPGDLPDFSGDPALPPVGPLDSGVKNAIVLNLGVRLQDAFGLPNNSALKERADRALQLIQAINLQQLPMPVGLDPLSILFILNLALRAAGRINDKQNVDGGSQDAFDAQYHAVQMIEEWKREREIFVIPGDLPDLSGDIFSPPIGTLGSGVKNAIILNLGVRLQDAFGLPNNSALKERADRALQLVQAINLQQVSAPTIAADDGTGYGIIYLALRAAGRVSDKQGVLQSSQDVTDAHSFLNEMLDEWQREREVRVIPGLLSPIIDLTLPLTLTTGERNAVVLNLAVRLRDAFGVEVSKTFADRADKALALLQAINLQQNAAPVIAADDGTGYGIIFLALRAAGRVNDQQGVKQSSQDVTDAASLMREMLDEWQRQRVVLVIPGMLPDLGDLTVPLTLDPGVRNAIVLNLAVRLRDAFGVEVSKTLIDRAALALELIQAINLQQVPVNPTIDPSTPLGIIWLALRAAGRLTDKQGIDPASQDVTDAHLLLLETVDEWQRDRNIRVNPGALPDLRDLNAPIVGDFVHGMRNALTLNLAVRLRDLWGQEVPKTLQDRADRALQLIQAQNLQQFPPPVVDPSTPRALAMMALRAAGRITDMQGADPASQDVFEAWEHMAYMIDEWERERNVRVIPGDLPDVRSDIDAPITGTFVHGMRNAIIYNLAVRLRRLWGQEVPKDLDDAADRALQLIQAINAQQIDPLVPGVPATVRQACVLALRLAGRINDQQRVSDTSTDMNDALSLLVMMLGQWQRKRWLVWNEAETAKVSTGNQWYSVGPGGDFNMPRPDKLHGGFCRMKPFGGPNPVDLHLSIIESKEDWAKITIKDLKSLPEALFYDSAFPQGRVTFYPVPSANDYELHILTKAQLPVYVHLTDQLLVPPEYLDAIVNNLALRLPGAQITPLLLGQARASLETIRMANAQVSVLSLPGILGGRGGDVSSWSGRGLNRAWIVGSEAVL